MATSPSLFPIGMPFLNRHVYLQPKYNHGTMIAAEFNCAELLKAIVSHSTCAISLTFYSEAVLHRFSGVYVLVQFPLGMTKYNTHVFVLFFG